MRFTRCLVTVVAVGTLVAGCSPQPAPPPEISVEAAETSSGAPSPDPTVASPAPEPTVASTSTSDLPVVSTAGYGDVRLGQPVPSTTELLVFDEDACGPGRDVWRSPDGSDDVPGVVGPITRDGAVEQLRISSPTVMTVSGAHVGMDATELAELFPTGKRVERGDVDLLVVSDSSGRVAFEIASARGELWGDDVVDTVLLIQVVRAGDKIYPWSLNGPAFTLCGLMH